MTQLHFKELTEIKKACRRGLWTATANILSKKEVASDLCSRGSGKPLTTNHNTHPKGAKLYSMAIQKFYQNFGNDDYNRNLYNNI